MPLNKVTADSIADGTVVASDIADGTITLAKLQSGLLPPAIANSAAAYANAAFATANTGTASGSYANSAFAAANTASASGSYANSAFSYANSAFATANTGSASGSYANSAFSTANTASTNATNAGGYANSAFAKANTAGTGTVTSVATGNGLSGGTIPSTGTLVVACPSYNSVGSYVLGQLTNSGAYTSGASYPAGGASDQLKASNGNQQTTNNLSGTWRAMSSGASTPCSTVSFSLFCRVS